MSDEQQIHNLTHRLEIAEERVKALEERVSHAEMARDSAEIARDNAITLRDEVQERAKRKVTHAGHIIQRLVALLKPLGDLSPTLATQVAVVLATKPPQLEDAREDNRADPTP